MEVWAEHLARVKKPITPVGRSFLDKYRTAGHGVYSGKAIAEFSKHHGFAKCCYDNCRSQQNGFSEEFDLTRERHKNSSDDRHHRRVTRREPKHKHEDSLYGAQDAFITTWKQSGSRVQALDDAGIRWGKVKKWLKHDKYFKAQYDEVMEIVLLAVEDSLLESAKAGKTMAQTRVLEAFSEKWSQKVNHRHEIAGNILFTQDSQEMAKDTWKEITKGEVIDVEERPQLPAPQ